MHLRERHLVQTLVEGQVNLPLVLPLVQVVLGELLRVLVVDVLLALSSFALVVECESELCGCCKSPSATGNLNGSRTVISSALSLLMVTWDANVACSSSSQSAMSKSPDHPIPWLVWYPMKMPLSVLSPN